jgi:hypothetical protein
VPAEGAGGGAVPACDWLAGVLASDWLAVWAVSLLVCYVEHANFDNLKNENQGYYDYELVIDKTKSSRS